MLLSQIISRHVSSLYSFSNYLQFHCRRCCPGDGGGVIINMFQFCRTCYDVSISLTKYKIDKRSIWGTKSLDFKIFFHEILIRFSL